MNDTQAELLEEYHSVLEEYLAGAGEAALQRVYELAREAMSENIGVLDMAMIHHEAMTRVLRAATTPEDRSRLMKAAEVFFVESLSPFEMTHRAFREANTALRRLNDRLEEEAKRIAHSLHEEAGQLLASVYIALDEVADDLPSQSRERFIGIKDLLDGIGDQLRRLSHELRPTILDDLGLLPALRFLAEGVSTRTGIPISVAGKLKSRLPPAVETGVYRIVREALNNLSRHSRATRASIKVVREERTVRCSIQDDGTGFDVAGVVSKNTGGGLGLLGIQERVNALGGTLQILSSPGQGTKLIITIPTEA